MTPEIIICIEDGNVTHVATSEILLGKEFCYRVLDFDQLRIGEKGQFDYTADVYNVDIEKHTKMLLEGV